MGKRKFGDFLGGFDILHHRFLLQKEEEQAESNGRQARSGAPDRATNRVKAITSGRLWVAIQDPCSR